MPESLGGLRDFRLLRGVVCDNTPIIVAEGEAFVGGGYVPPLFE
jgi:hypothetical protein